jgi:chemosensory pili system protein ChpB (putative protein-glutamate methylesterase)
LSGAARNVWVLGASLGGPEAVSDFLAELPAQLPVCFLYAQHIEQNFCELLSQVMARNGGYDVCVLGAGGSLRHGQFAVVPVDMQLRFVAEGRFASTGECWPKPYAPAIDQVVYDIGAAYGATAGTIIFSGMGNDGASACEFMRSQQGSVWAQRPDTCICPSMPEAAIATGAVEIQASPAELAHALVQRYSHSLELQDQL